MKKLLVFCVVTGASWAAETAKPPDPLAAMQASIERQRAAVEKQRESVARQFPAAQGSSGAFFTVPWYQPRPEPACEPMPKDQVESLLKTAAEREGLKPDLLRAVIGQESGFRPCAVSPKGAMGLMQLMPATVEQFGVQDPFDPKQSVDAGAKFLKQLLTRYSGDVKLALGAYNSGPARVDASGGVPDIPETLNYVQRILESLPH